MTELDAAKVAEYAAEQACKASHELCKTLDAAQKSWLLRRENATTTHFRNLMALDRAKETRKKLEESCTTIGG